MRTSILTLTLTGLATVACTDADLYLIEDLDTPKLKLKLEAELCAPEPVIEQVPYKILFVVDTSLSNTWNDTDEKRVDAYVRAVTEHADSENVSFGVITFNEYAHKPTLMFTRDQRVLQSIAETLSNDQAGGGTNYEDGISSAFDFILNDMGASPDPAEALRTRYIVHWLSDGFPTYGTTEAYTIMNNINAMTQYLLPRVGDFRFNTLYLESTGEWETPAEIDAARGLLLGMSQAGHGEFTNVSAGTTFDFHIDPTPQIREFELVGAVAANRHVVFGTRYPLPDSDADGVDDEREIELGTDPTLRDTDGDGFGDGVELIGSLDPLVVDGGCTSPGIDADRDGLSDCEEAFLRTGPNNPDSDDDQLPDGLEVLLGGAPMSYDPASDRDIDGISDRLEVMQHLDPRVPTSADEADSWGYAYQIVEKVVPDGAPRCWTVRVENLGLFETLETDFHPRGGQLIDVFATFRAINAEQIKRYVIASERARFLLPDVRDPVDGIHRIGTDAFSPIELPDD